MTKARKTWCMPAILLLIASAGRYSVWGACRVLIMVPEYRVQYVPDDTFCYLALARNYARSGLWTFDSGNSLTSGFHLLHAYVLAGLYRLLLPTPERFVQIAVFMSWLVLLPAMVLAAVFAVRHRLLVAAMAIFVLITARNVALSMVSAVEWSWVVSASAIYCTMLSQSSKLTTSSRRSLSHFACGFLGSVARTDYGLLPAVLFVASLLGLGGQGAKRRLLDASMGLAGTCGGVPMVLAHNQAVTGQMLQSSARMKNLWLSTIEPSFAPYVRLVLGSLGDLSPVPVVLGALLLFLAFAQGIRTYVSGMVRSLWSADRSDSEVDLEATMWLGGLLALVGYGVFYSLFATDAQNWYSASLLVPLFMVLCLPFARTRPHDRLGIAGIELFLLLGLCQVQSMGSLFTRPEWSHQVAMYEAGNYLRGAGLAGAIGSWNAGIIGYYEGATW